MPRTSIILLAIANLLLLVDSGFSNGEEIAPARVFFSADKGVEAAANNTIAALRSFRASPDVDTLADLHRATRSLSSQLNRHYSYFGPHASQKFEGSLSPILDAITASLKAYKTQNLNKQGTELTMRVVAECHFFISPRPLTR